MPSAGSAKQYRQKHFSISAVLNRRPPKWKRFDGKLVGHPGGLGLIKWGLRLLIYFYFSTVLFILLPPSPTLRGGLGNGNGNLPCD